MSGPQGALGQDQYDAFMMVVERNGGKLGGVPVQVLREDSQLKPDVATQIVQKLIEKENVPIITLPGNPVSSYISFENFVRPVIRRMRGLDDIMRPELRTVCEEAIDSPSGKRQFARARFVPSGAVVPTGTGQGSHVMGGLAIADALIVIPEDVTRVAAGDTVTVIDLRSR